MNKTADDIALTRLPPQNIDAEMMVLGACLIEPSVIGTARVRPEDFYKDVHRDLFALMQRLSERGESVDLITIMPEFRQTKYYDAVGGMSYPASLVAYVPTAANFRSHERLVIEAAQLRAIDRALRAAQSEVYGLAGGARPNPDAIVAGCVDTLNAVRRHEGDMIMRYSEIINLSYNEVEKRVNLSNSGKFAGIPTGFRGLDQKLHGLQPQFYVLAGASGMGKTAFAAQVVRNAASHLMTEWGALPEASRTSGPGSVGVISLEMGAGQIGLRDLSSASDVPLSRLLAGTLHDADWTKLAHAAGVLHPLPIYYAFAAFHDRQIERVIDDMVQRLGVKLIVCDYLQLERCENHEGTREQEVSKISHMHKRKVAQHQVPNLVISSLNRSLAGRPDKRPNKSDLRDSGSIEYDADVIMFVYRDEVYNCKCPKQAACLCDRRGKAEIIVDKGRMEGTGTVELQWNGRTTTFSDAPGGVE
ncbi:MAG: AAA family ATPase [Nitrospirae bacterium]|nr:AAA family ATPase [Nitrospirota bacterium]